MNRAEELRQEPAVHAHWPAKPYTEREHGPMEFFGTARAPRGRLGYRDASDPTLSVTLRSAQICVRTDTASKSFNTFINQDEARALALALLDAACALDEKLGRAVA